MVDEIKHHIVGITESWANNDIPDAELGLEGYVMFRKDRIGRRGFVQVVSPPLGWSPLSSFLVIFWSPSGDARGPSVIFEAVNMPCPGPFHLFTV